jgi:hypothetical protein
MSNKTNSLIEKKKKQIEKLAIEISDLMDKQIFEEKGFIEVDEIIKIKIGRKKSDVKEIKIKAGHRTWTEDFIDEDSGEIVSIEMSELVSVNGKRVDRLGRAVHVISRLIEVSSEKKAWDE